MHRIGKPRPSTSELFSSIDEVWKSNWRSMLRCADVNGKHAKMIVNS